MRTTIILCAMMMIALAPRLAASQEGIMGGMVALKGCLNECIETAHKRNFDHNVCSQFCPCMLTIEQSRWREEMSEVAIAARGERCNAEAGKWLEAKKAGNTRKQ